jgi:hypothetical protein
MRWRLCAIEWRCLDCYRSYVSMRKVYKCNRQKLEVRFMMCTDVRMLSIGIECLLYNAQ